MGARKVLIVDDDPAVRDVLKEYLTLDGHLVTVAENGSKAYEQFRFNRFDIVLLDINMPKMDGVETVKAIRERHRDVPIILISGQDDMDIVQEAIENGANEFIKKPFNIKSLMGRCF